MWGNGSWKGIKRVKDIQGFLLREKSPEFCAKRGREFLWLALLIQGQLQDEAGEDEEQGALGMKGQKCRSAPAVESPAGSWS